MYPNLRAEMAREHVTVEMLAQAMGVNIATASAKLNSYDRIKFSECRKIRDTFFPAMQIDYLFFVNSSQPPTDHPLRTNAL